MAKPISRGRRLSSRPFYTSVLLLSLLTAYSFLAHTTYGSSFGRDNALIKRSSSSSSLDALECRDVHTADDKCAFVKQYCVDDDAGLIPYLTIYYCQLGSVTPIGFTLLVVWVGLLFTTIGIAASDFFSVNLSTIATILGLSESLAGVTFLAFGNGSPDVFSTFAAMGSNSASMAVGELIGAASFITGVVAGSMALIREFRVDRRTYARDICFFIVAVAFTMVFLADGHLHFWECWLMIGYYIIYVITVVLWHWYSTKRKARLRREGEARSHVYGPSGHAGDELAGEPYRDDPDDVDSGISSGQATPMDISALEAGPRIEVDGHKPPEDEEDDNSSTDHERLVAAEVASSMRVLRTRGKRSHTMTPIRPSLVGALEFRSALAHLQREGNLQLSSIPGRSHSENQVPRVRRGTTTAIPEYSQTDSQLLGGSLDFQSRRERALSSSDAPALAEAPELLIPIYEPSDDHSERQLSVPTSPASGTRMSSPSPSFTIDGSLAPPPRGPTGASHDAHEAPYHRPILTPQLHLKIPTQSGSHSDPSSPAAPFPLYTDSPAMLTPHPHEQADFTSPSPLTRESPFADLQIPAEPPKPVKWWPYSVLPPPHVLLATVFPTLQGWEGKTIWDKFVSAISVPSIFLLVITLPVVESESTDEESLVETFIDPSSQRRLSVGCLTPAISIRPDSAHSETEWQRYQRRSTSRGGVSNIAATVSPGVASQVVDDSSEISGSSMNIGPPAIPPKPLSEYPSVSNANDECAGWNRWLVALQLFTGPQFAVFILWANMMEEWDNPGKVYVKMMLYTLLASLVLLGVLIMLTNESSRPRYHYLLCFLGFIISIAWISTIAGEVVGVLKTVGVILGISEALLGLTIFAAGNSVGDLIADITVARLGYPVMALSACFGGPMLNILLGIGIGGVIMMVQKANSKHRKNPDHPIRYKPYKIQIGGTLMISAITLLVTLMLLLIIVPMNKWILSRRIGYGLIALWVVSTIVNVVVELTGAWGDMS